MRQVMAIGEKLPLCQRHLLTHGGWRQLTSMYDRKKIVVSICLRSSRLSAVPAKGSVTLSANFLAARS